MSLLDELNQALNEYKGYHVNDLEPILQHRIEVPFYSLILSELKDCFTDEELVRYCSTDNLSQLSPAIATWRAKGLFDKDCGGARGLSENNVNLVAEAYATAGYQVFPPSAKDRYYPGTTISRLDLIQYLNEMKPTDNLDLSQIGATMLRFIRDSVGFSPIRLNLEDFPEIKNRLKIHEITEDDKVFWLATFTYPGTINETVMRDLAYILFQQLGIHTDISILLWYTAVNDKKATRDIFNRMPRLYGMPDATALELGNELKANKARLNKPFIHMFDESIQTSYNYSVRHIINLLTS